MKANDLAILVAEIKNGGPGPVIAGQPKPTPVLFSDETEMTAGKVVTSIFGEQALATLVVTSYRRLLLLRKGGRDLCHSSWHKIDFGDWRWQEADGFTVAGIETTFPVITDQITEDGPPATWQTYFVSPTGERRLLEEVTVYLNQYYHHQQNRYALWKENISPTGKPEHAQFAFVFFGYKMLLDKQTPGVVDLDSLWSLYTDPVTASQKPGGSIPEDSPFHPSKAKRTTKVTASRVSKGSIARKVLRTAIGGGSQVKGIVETAQKVAGLAGSFGVGAAAAPGGGAAELPAGIMLCAQCGAPLGAGALFCARCGHRLGEAIVAEIEDQIKDQVEGAAVERIQRALDPDDQIELICPNCDKKVQPDWKFCPECVHPLPLACPRCGEKVQPDWKVCPHCTARLQA